MGFNPLLGLKLRHPNTKDVRGRRELPNNGGKTTRVFCLPLVHFYFARDIQVFSFVGNRSKSKVGS